MKFFLLILTVVVLGEHSTFAADTNGIDVLAVLKKNAPDCKLRDFVQSDEYLTKLQEDLKAFCSTEQTSKTQTFLCHMLAYEITVACKITGNTRPSAARYDDVVTVDEVCERKNIQLTNQWILSKVKNQETSIDANEQNLCTKLAEDKQILRLARFFYKIAPIVRKYDTAETNNKPNEDKKSNGANAEAVKETKGGAETSVGSDKKDNAATSAKDERNSTVDSTKTTAKEKVGQSADGAKTKTEVIADAGKEKAGETADATKKKTEETVDATKEKAGETTDATKKKTEETVDATKKKAGETADATKKKIEENADDEKDKAEEAADDEKDKAEKSADGEKDKAEKSADGGKDKTEQTVDGTKGKTGQGAEQSADAAKDKNSQVVETAKHGNEGGQQKASETGDGAKDKASATQTTLAVATNKSANAIDNGAAKGKQTTAGLLSNATEVLTKESADKKQNILDIAKSDKVKDEKDQTDKQSQQEKGQVPAPNVETKKPDAKEDETTLLTTADSSTQQKDKLVGDTADKEPDVDNDEEENNEGEQKPKDTQDNTKKDKDEENNDDDELPENNGQDTDKVQQPQDDEEEEKEDNDEQAGEGNFDGIEIKKTEEKTKEEIPDKQLIAPDPDPIPIRKTAKQRQRYPEDEGWSGSFVTYFLVFTLIVVVGYLVLHNKNKLMAYALEGRRSGGSRTGSRPSHRGYEKLRNVNDVIPIDETETVSK